jgi:hypothetical protein
MSAFRGNNNSLGLSLLTSLVWSVTSLIVSSLIEPSLCRTTARGETTTTETSSYR